MKTFNEFVEINEGGHRIPKIKAMSPQEFRAYFKAGLGRKADLRPAHWQRAVDVMNVAVSMGYVKPQDLGKGNGKYVTSPMYKTKTHDQIADMMLQSRKNWGDV